MERIGITTLVTKQNRSSSSLRHVTNCLVEGKECGEGNENCSLPLQRMGMHANTIIVFIYMPFCEEVMHLNYIIMYTQDVNRLY